MSELFLNLANPQLPISLAGDETLTRAHCCLRSSPVRNGPFQKGMLF